MQGLIGSLTCWPCKPQTPPTSNSSHLQLLPLTTPPTATPSLLKLFPMSNISHLKSRQLPRPPLLAALTLNTSNSSHLRPILVSYGSLVKSRHSLLSDSRYFKCMTLNTLYTNHIPPNQTSSRFIIEPSNNTFGTFFPNSWSVVA